MPPAIPPDSDVHLSFGDAPSSAWKRSWTRAWADTPVTHVRDDDAPVKDTSWKDSMAEGTDSMNCGSLTHLTEEVDALVKDFGEQVKALVTFHVHLPVPQEEQTDWRLTNIQGAEETAQEHELNSHLGSMPVWLSQGSPEDPVRSRGASGTMIRAISYRSGKSVKQIVQENVITPYTAEDCLFEASRTRLMLQQTWLQGWTRSQFYEWWSGTLILANALFIGVQTEYAARDAREAGMAGQSQPVGEEHGFLIGSAIFTLFFTIELSLRWVSEGFFGLFRTHDGNWYLFDVVLMILSWIDSVAGLLYFSQVKTGQANIFSSISVLRILRMARIVKLARVIRLLSFFRELRLMVYSIFSSLKSLIWLTLILMCTFYIFAITFTSGLVSHTSPAALWTGESWLGVRESFGTLDRSLLSLYMGMSGGRNWGEYYHMFAESLPLHYNVIFLVFITFTIFAVMNTVTGVFVELAMRANVNSRQVTINEELASKKKFLRELHNLFHEMDVNGDGCISYQEFCHRLADERVIAYFKALSLDVHDTRALFNLLDVDHSGKVDMMEFLHGCYQLQGDARSIDTKMIRMMQKRIVEQICALLQAQHEQKAALAHQANLLAVTINRAKHPSGDAADGASKGSNSKFFCNRHAGSGNENTWNCQSHGHAESKIGSTLASCKNDSVKATVSETPMGSADSLHTSMSHAHSEHTNAEKTQVAAARPRQCTDMFEEMKQQDREQVAMQGDAWDSHLHHFLANDPGRRGSPRSWDD